MPKGIRRSVVDRTIFVAKETFMTIVEDVPVTIVKGTTVRAGHALHKGREMLFAPLKVEYDVAHVADVPVDPEPKPEPEPEPVEVAEQVKKFQPQTK